MSIEAPFEVTTYQKEALQLGATILCFPKVDSSFCTLDKSYYVYGEFTSRWCSCCGVSHCDRCNEWNSEIRNDNIIYFKIIDIQNRKAQEISHNNGEIYSIYPNAHEDGYANFMHGFDEKFLGGKYEENLEFSLLRIERLEQNK